MPGVPLLNEITTSVTNLSASDLQEFRRWFDQFDTEQWDRQFEQHVSDGKVDAVARKAIERLRQGECDEL